MRLSAYLIAFVAFWGLGEHSYGWVRCRGMWASLKKEPTLDHLDVETTEGWRDECLFRFWVHAPLTLIVLPMLFGQVGLPPECRVAPMPLVILARSGVFVAMCVSTLKGIRVRRRLTNSFQIIDEKRSRQAVNAAAALSQENNT